MSFIRPLLKISSSSSQNIIRHLSVSQRVMSTEMPFTFASPAGIFYTQATNVKQVDVPTLSGSFGILAGHVPTLGVLKPGIVTVTEAEGAVKKFFVSAGSVAVNPDSSVQLLAEEAFAIEDLDLSAAQAQLAEAQSSLSSASGEEAKAEAQIAVDTAESIVRAINTGM